jgi:hypothetical protein
MYKQLYVLDFISKVLKAIGFVLVSFLILQILLGYFKHEKQHDVLSDQWQFNAIKNSFIQVNADDNNLYIKSDIIETSKDKIILKNNFITSNVGFGTSDVITYDRTTKDISLKNRPKLTLVE